MDSARECVLAAADRLVDAFGRHDREAYFAAFAPDASFIFYNLDRVLTSRAAYEREWRLWEERDGFRVLGCRSSDRNVRMAGECAIFTHQVETDLLMGGERLSNRERETIVFAHDGEGRWVAIHEHLSALPA
jgi:ketosteroid isomerase-like protein